jgi:RNA polymerase sigma-70 factor (ECF subfamily)
MFGLAAGEVPFPRTEQPLEKNMAGEVMTVASSSSEGAAVETLSTTPSTTSERPTEEASDHSLLRRFRRGSQDAATQLYLRYVHRIRALVRSQCSPELARRVDADDIVQSVFHRFFRRVRDGDYDVPPGEELWGLFLVISLNKIRAEETFHRAGKRDVRMTVAGEHTQEVLAAHADADQGPLTVLLMTIDEALKQLPPQIHQMVELRIQGYEVADIARETKRSKRTVERSLQEFRHKLRTLLDSEDRPHDPPRV